MKQIIQIARRWGIAIALLFFIQNSVTAQNNCLHFDGVDDYVDCGTINPAVFSIEVWVYPNILTIDQAIASTLNEVTPAGFELHLSTTGLPAFTLRNNSIWVDVAGASAIPLNTWTHIAATFDGTSAKLYVNGILAATEVVSSYTTGANILKLGIRSNTASTQYFNGSLDEISIWTKALTSVEIQEHMYSNLNVSESELYTYYKFNQGTAEGNNTSETTLIDATSNSNDGTLNSFALSGTTSNWVSGQVKPEPTNNATAFTASLNGGNIELRWTDAIGTILPEGYIIMASSTNNFTNPVDGTNIIVDNDLNDGLAVVKVNQGLQVYSNFRNTTLETSYYFKIYSYTNSDTYINYKIEDTVQTTQCDIPFFTYLPTSIYAFNQGAGVWVDIDIDGDLDIITSGLYKVNTANYYNTFCNYNLADSTFKASSIYNAFLKDPIIACADYDNDGDIDFAISGFNRFDDTPETSIYKNNSGTFTKQTEIDIEAVYKGALAWFDFNNDGSKDLIVTGLDNTTTEITKIYKNKGNNTFTELLLTNLEGIRNGTLVCGDYNNDGYCDFLLSGGDYFEDDEKTILYKNNGNATFTAQENTNLPILGNSDADWGDYDNDGYLDLLLGGYISNSGGNDIIAVYKNSGNNTFTQQEDIKLEQSDVYRSVTWADYDNDGYLDIFSLSNDEETVIYHNDKDGTFSSSSNITTLAAGKPCFGDFDNDGDLDALVLAIMDNDYITNIYINNDTSTNTPPTIPNGLSAIPNNEKIIFNWNKASDNTTPLNGITYNIRIGTTSGGSEIISAQALADGKLLMPTEGNRRNDTTFEILLPVGDYYWSVQAIDKSLNSSAFATEQTLTVLPVQAYNLKADIRSTTSLMLSWTNGSSNNHIVFCKKSNSGTASPKDSIYYSSSQIFGEGDQIEGSDWFCVYNGKEDSCMVYGLNPDYGYMFHTIEYSTQTGFPIYLNSSANGNPALFGVSVFLKQPCTVTGISETLKPSSTSWCDFDNDGFLDLFIANDETSKIYKNNGDYSFSEFADLGVICKQSAWGDYDNDGYIDLLISGAIDTEAKLFKNSGGTSFSDMGYSLPKTYSGDIEWGDYNNDGYLDIVFTGSDFGVTTIFENKTISSSIYLNNQGVEFTEQELELPALYNSSVAWGDYDNDGYLDLIIAGYQQISEYEHKKISKLYHNNHDYTITEQTQVVLDSFQFVNIGWADFNNDGLLDIYMNGLYTEASTVIFINDNNSTFTRNTFSNVNNFFLNGTITPLDYDNDGYLDLYISGSKYFDNKTKLYHNDYATNNVLEFSTVANTSFVANSYAVTAFGDYDNDGDQDAMVMSHNDSDFSNIYSNNTIMRAGNFATNDTASAPQTLSKEPLRGGMLLSWDNVTTDETPGSTMSYNIRVGTSKDNLNLYAPHFVDSTDYKKRTVTKMGNACLNSFYKIYNLPDLANNKYYYWQVQAIDGGFMGGEWSVVDSFQVEAAQAYFTFNIACEKDTILFKDESVAYDEITSWQWNFGDNSGLNYEQHPKHVYQTAGEHNVKLVVTNSQGKTDTITQSVYVKPTPNVSFSATDGCGAFSTAIENLTTTNGLVNSWSWEFGDGQTSIYGDPLSHVYTSIGEYTLTLTATDTNGCSSKSTEDIVITTKPSANLTLEYGNQAFCFGDSVIYSVPFNADYSYQWQRNDEVILNDTNQLKVKSIDESGAYKVIVTNNLANTCSDTSAVKNITVTPMPVSPIIKEQNNITNYCLGTEVNLMVDNASSVFNYQWQRSGVNIDGETDSKLSGKLRSGDYSVVARAGVCEAESEIITLTTKPAPTKPPIYARGPVEWMIICDTRGAEGYRWYYNGELIKGADLSMYFANSNLGEYYFEINDGGECWTMSDIISIPLEKHVEETKKSVQIITVRPNPSKGIFKINLGTDYSGKSKVTIYNSFGNNVLTEEYNGINEITIDFSNRENGIYLCNIEKEGTRVMMKLIKE